MSFDVKEKGCIHVQLIVYAPLPLRILSGKVNLGFSVFHDLEDPRQIGEEELPCVTPKINGTVIGAC